MAIGIVIPAYNAESFLAQTLESVRAQTRPDWELVVVDDGSADRSAEIAERYADSDTRIRLIRQGNCGTARSRNAGAAAIPEDVDFALFLDHDDMLAPDALERLSSALAASPSAVAAHGLASRVNSAGNPMGEGEASIQNFHRKKLVAGKPVNASRDEPTNAAMVIYDNLIPTPGVALIRRDCLKRLTKGGGLLFDPSATPLDDWDFWLRLTRLGDIAFLDQVVLQWRRHEKAGSLDVAAMCAAGLRIRERLVAENLPPELAEIAAYRYSRLLATEHRRAARKLFRAGKWSQGAREYAAYMMSRVSPERNAL